MKFKNLKEIYIEKLWWNLWLILVRLLGIFAKVL